MTRKFTIPEIDRMITEVREEMYRRSRYPIRSVSDGGEMRLAAGAFAHLMREKLSAANETPDCCETCGSITDCEHEEGE